MAPVEWDGFTTCIVKIYLFNKPHKTCASDRTKSKISQNKELFYALTNGIQSSMKLHCVFEYHKNPHCSPHMCPTKCRRTEARKFFLYLSVFILTCPNIRGYVSIIQKANHNKASRGKIFVFSYFL